MRVTDPFDRFATALAEEMPRRQALRRAGGFLAAAIAFSLGLESAAWSAAAECRDFCREWFGSRGRRQRQACMRICRRCSQHRKPTCLVLDDSDYYADCCQQPCCGALCCGSGETCCQSPDGSIQECVDLDSNNQHCGRCNNPIPDSASSRCCHGKIANLQSDPQNCGECGHLCDFDEVCVHGSCAPSNIQCGTGEQPCYTPAGFLAGCCRSDLECCFNLIGEGGFLCCDPAQGDACCVVTPETGVRRCVHTRTDRSHCGRCGNACGDNEVCSGGVCHGCAADEWICLNTCVGDAWGVGQARTQCCQEDSERECVFTCPDRSGLGPPYFCCTLPDPTFPHQLRGWCCAKPCGEARPYVDCGLGNYPVFC